MRYAHASAVRTSRALRRYNDGDASFRTKDALTVERVCGKEVTQPFLLVLGLYARTHLLDEYQSFFLAFGLLAVALFAVGCNLIEFVQQPAAASQISGHGIVFVTVTPEGQITLNEGQRSRSAPTPEPTATPAPYFAGANEMGKILVGAKI